MGALLKAPSKAERREKKKRGGKKIVWVSGRSRAAEKSTHLKRGWKSLGQLDVWSKTAWIQEPLQQKASHNGEIV